MVSQDLLIDLSHIKVSIRHHHHHHHQSSDVLELEESYLEPFKAQRIKFNHCFAYILHQNQVFQFTLFYRQFDY